MKRAARLGLAIPLSVGVLTTTNCFAQAAPDLSTSTTKQASPQAGGAQAPTEEIVVTASKRPERLVDVPISIVAISGSELQTRQITSLDDLSKVVPDLSYNNIGSNHYFAIRGISNIIGASPLIGIYLDEADVTIGGRAATQISPITYDVDRVEVLRGPQGTLYGEGSEGGTIRFVMRNPDLNRPGLAADFSTQYTEHGEIGGRVNAVANIPLVDDKLAVRVVGTLERDGGWIDQPAAGKSNINGQNLANLRVKLLWQAAPSFTVSTLVIVNRSKRGTDQSDTDNSYRFTQAFNLTTTSHVKSNYELYNLTLAYDLGAAHLLNTSSYLRVSTPFENQTQTFPLLGPGQPTFDYYAPLETAQDRVFTDELRLSSAGNGPLNYTAGGFYRRFRDDVDFPVNYFGIPSGTTLPAPYSSDQNTLYNSVSGFLDTSYRFWDKFTVGAGVRYFHDHQNFDDLTAGMRQVVNFSSTDPRFYARYKLAPKASLYASVAKGFRSGGFNAADQPAYKPESVWTYEVGAKGELFDDRLSADAALFWSRYQGYQVFGIIDASTGLNYIENAGDARIRGIEWDFTYRPVSALRFDVRGDYVDAVFTKVTSATFVDGDRVNLVPRYQVTVSGQYNFMLGTDNGFARLDYSQQGRQISRDRSVGDFYFGESDTLHLLDFNASLDLNKSMHAGVFVQNITNEQGFANPYSYIEAGVRPRPRTYGITFGFQM